MPIDIIKALTERAGSQFVVKSPAVGLYWNSPDEGTVLIGGSFAGKLQILNSVYELHIPDDVFGIVVPSEQLDRVTKVEYGQELFRLNPQESLVDVEKHHLAEVGAHHEEQGNGFVITAFTDGIFYRRPSPDAPPYVKVGDRIEKGKTLGLIEVMKSFNHIIFKGTDKSDVGIVEKVYIDDSAEVKSGEPLFLISDE